MEISSFYTCVSKITIIWYMLPEIWNKTDIILSFWAIFSPFYPTIDPKNKKFGINVKKPGDIILLHMCIKNQNHIMYGSLDIRHDKQSFLSFWASFCPLTLLITWKIKVLIKWKICLKRLSFYTCIPQMMIIWCMVPEIWSVTDRIFSHFGPFFVLHNLENQNFEKMKKMPVNIIISHKCTINDNHIMYDS